MKSDCLLMNPPPERELSKEIYVKGKGRRVANACKKRYMENNPKKKEVCSYYNR